ncbi:MAG: hypothetical protein N4A71_00960 [Carboxylicivirga sp.]|nr:hypothetical protein [Carboxylicivirga sp.]
MRFYSICLVLVAVMSSCHGKAKKQRIEQRIIEMKIEQEVKDSINDKQVTSETDTLDLAGDLAPEGDKIIGVWEVNNDYYQAIYEIIKYENQYFGKVHYYHDGTKEYKGNNTKEDYFLEGIFYKEGKYTQSKMHMPDGSVKLANFVLKGDDLNVSMTIEGHPYKEVWKRQKAEN